MEESFLRFCFLMDVVEQFEQKKIYTSTAYLAHIVDKLHEAIEEIVLPFADTKAQKEFCVKISFKDKNICII